MDVLQANLILKVVKDFLLQYPQGFLFLDLTLLLDPKFIQIKWRKLTKCLNYLKMTHYEFKVGEKMIQHLLEVIDSLIASFNRTKFFL